MGRFAVISMTEKAAARVNEIMATRENAKGVRLGIKKGGCAGMEYTVDLVTEPNPKDDHIERDGAHVYVAPEAALFLFGTVMDFEATTLHLHQSKPEFYLRLRRIGRAQARRFEAACRGPRAERSVSWGLLGSSLTRRMMLSEKSATLRDQTLLHPEPALLVPVGDRFLRIDIECPVAVADVRLHP